MAVALDRFRPGTWVVGAGLFALAFAARALSWPGVLSPRGVHLPEPDAWYHLRRLVYAVRNAPESLGFDPFLNFPHGATAIWPPLLDTALGWLLGGVASGASGVDLATLERLAAWVPPVIGALGVVALYVLGRRHFGAAVGTASGLVLAVLPGAVAYGRVGMLDHHVFVAALAVVGLDAAMRLVDALQRAGRPGPWLPALVLAAWHASSLEVWPGALLHTGLVDAGLLVFWLTRPRREDAVRAGAWLSGIFAGSALLLAWGTPARPEHLGAWTPVALSHFQPALFAAGAGVTALLSGFWHRAPVADGRGRLLQGLALCAAVALAAIVTIPGVGTGLQEAWTWLARSERFQESVLESRPLWMPEDGGSGFDLEPALRRLSAFALGLPFAWAWLAALAWRNARSEQLLFVGWSAGVGAAAVLQIRFVNSVAPAAALLFGLVAVEAARRLAGRGPFAGRPRMAAACVVVISGLLLAPALATQVLPVRNAIARLRGEPVSLTRKDLYWLALEEVALWIRERTPPAGDPWDAAAHPRYGLLGHWQTGHLLLYRGQRPVVVSNFGDDVQGDNYRLSFEYFRLPEEKAVELLDRLRARYVVVRPLDFGRPPPGGDSLLERFADPDAGDASRHRLIYERRVLRGGHEAPRGHFRVFERVEGARVEGRAAPGIAVEARLPYVSPTGRRGSFVQRARADAAGRYALRLPYATDAARAAVVTADAWELHAGSGEPRRLAVPERAVREGLAVEGPSLP